MKINKTIVIFFVVLALGIAFIGGAKMLSESKMDALSGATPPALAKKVPQGILLTVDGKVKKTYTFNHRSFSKLAKTRIRTAEITPGGNIMGAYTYTGVPVLYILETVAPLKEKNAVFDRPLDMIVVFTSASGKTARFSYGELTMNTDSYPITLAYDREPVLPSKEPGKYTKNKYKGKLNGLRLICPREPDSSRFLDNVVRLTLTVPITPDKHLPLMQKNKKCTSDSISCVEGDKVWSATYKDVPIVKISDWFRIGHGRGIKGDRLSTVSGFQLPSFLKQNFPAGSPDDFFVFVGCDGYRSIYSGREIFCSEAGKSIILMKTIDGKAPKGGHTIAATSDFFLDRCVWGLSHVVRLKGDSL